ncbi:hypothetical protein [Pseudokordiimonas caeni]|uniref:hypothetical protein n=1 Tax=Pseudokordiimonas caeni TaxID=2997908 RepID=UPI0028116D49|nr:hypothetical protein [Pseudokordiimonas caeni]
MIRSTSKSVTFAHPFTVAGFDEMIEAGRYNIEIDEEIFEGLTFAPVMRRTVHMFLHDDPSHPGMSRMLSVDADAFALALEHDVALSRANSRRPEQAPKAAIHAGSPLTPFDKLALARADDDGMPRNGRLAVARRRRTLSLWGE